MFLLVPAYLGCPGQTAVKFLLLLLLLVKSTCSTVSLSVERISKFVNLVNLLYIIVELRYVIMSFILENERSQPATEIDIVNRICSPTFKLGNMSFPPNDSELQDTKRSYVNSYTSADKNLTVLYFIHKTSTVDVVWECCRKICTFPLQVIKVNSFSSHERFSVQQEAKSFVQILELLKPSIRTSRDCVKSRLHHSPCLFLCCKSCICFQFSWHLLLSFDDLSRHSTPHTFSSRPAWRPHRTVLTISLRPSMLSAASRKFIFGSCNLF